MIGWKPLSPCQPTCFYNTGIQNLCVDAHQQEKMKTRRGKVQLIDASGERFWQSMRKKPW